MGGSRGYSQMPTLSPEKETLLNSLLQQYSQYGQQAAQGFSQFLPGGGGGEAMKEAANKNYQQQTIPSILNAFGSGTKGSSSLNQALASSGADLNTNLGSQLAQMQLSAAQGLGSLGLGGQQMGFQTPSFAYLQRQPPVWQTLLQSIIPAVGYAGRAAIGGL